MTKTPSSQPKKIKKQSETTIFHDEMAIFVAMIAISLLENGFPCLGGYDDKMSETDESS